MKCWVALGSNLGDKKTNLELAARKLKQLSSSSLRVSPLFSTSALMPPGAPPSWNIPYLNAVVEIEWDQSAQRLLQQLQLIEQDLGRTPSEKWAPRLIDIDLILFGNEQVKTANLLIPHPEMTHRSFVLDPLKHLVPSLIPPGSNQSILQLSRKLSSSAPTWMNILNMTPDSFSDGGVNADFSALQNKLQSCLHAGIGYIDLGAESTRPKATPVNPDEEWKRLQPVLEWLRDQRSHHLFYPKISIDTRHAKTAERALEMGADCINDVSASADPRMIELLQSHHCEYVFMHSLTVPANPQVTLSEDSDPVTLLHQWVEEKINFLTAKGIALDRLIFDPGLGFGKTADQSITLIKRASEFSDLPVRILYGHSRKSFLNKLTSSPAAERDWESIGVSMQLAVKGIDFLRVHEAPLHARAHTAFQEVR